jgi:hypothetical protein
MTFDSWSKLHGIPALPIASRQPASFAPARGINFGGLVFSEPTPFDTELKQAYGGIYAIMVFDPTWSPRLYRPIYFGEAGDFSERVRRSHENYSSWVRAASGGVLFVAFHLIADARNRKSSERQLIAKYSPECNQIHNSLVRLLGRIPQ